ncbi:type I restriction enzyme, S subunit [Micrococcus terreus]|uniref:Type I restriction enzyme, S subunit n=2 Tax=Micrococcus terreus TaxID=574650 RepID=A0A1I7MN41_9MICC|nr:type I restriction enzyme, S subunit [Micrococcus terreus]
MASTGDLLMTAAGSLGTSYLVPAGQEICFAGYLVRFRPDTTKVHPRYVAWWTQSRDHLDQLELGAVRSTIDNFSASKFRRMSIPVPAFAKQQRIADYLDRETATIDALIEKQRHLIAGLRERMEASWRKIYATVLETVPPLPLKRHVYAISDGPFGSALTSAHYTDGGVRVIRLGNIGAGVFKNEDEAYISPEYGERLKRYSVRPGDLVMAGLGDSSVPLGRTAVVPDGLGPAINKADCFRLRLRPGADPRYMVIALNAPQTREMVLQLAHGSTRQRMNTTVAAQLPIAVPAPDVRANIVLRWERETAKIDALIAKAERFIELAQERRAALITAAVTGQIEIPTED